MPQQESSKIDFFNTTVLNNLRWFTSPFCFICLCNQIHTTVPVYCICKASFDKLLFKENFKNLLLVFKVIFDLLLSS